MDSAYTYQFCLPIIITGKNTGPKFDPTKKDHGNGLDPLECLSTIFLSLKSSHSSRVIACGRLSYRPHPSNSKIDSSETKHVPFSTDSFPFMAVRIPTVNSELYMGYSLVFQG